MRKTRKTTKNTNRSVAKNVEAIATKAAEKTDEFINSPEVKEATEAVRETIKDSAENIVKPIRTKISDITLEIFETTVAVADIEKAVKAHASEKNLKGDIRIYVNAEQRAAYYTVNNEGSEDQKIDLKTL